MGEGEAPDGGERGEGEAVEGEESGEGKALEGGEKGDWEASEWGRGGRGRLLKGRGGEEVGAEGVRVSLVGGSWAGCVPRGWSREGVEGAGTKGEPRMGIVSVAPTLGISCLSSVTWGWVLFELGVCAHLGDPSRGRGKSGVTGFRPDAGGRGGGLTHPPITPSPSPFSHPPRFLLPFPSPPTPFHTVRLSLLLFLPLLSPLSLLPSLPASLIFVCPPSTFACMHLCPC